MSTKTIALESSVYDRLARHKRQSESFSKVIDRILARVASAHTAADVLARLDEQPPLADEDAAAMAGVVRENRETETWPSHDLPLGTGAPGDAGHAEPAAFRAG